MDSKLEYSGSVFNEIVLSFHFIVILGKELFAFQSIAGIGMKRDCQFINEGGRNEYPIRLLGPQTTPYKLIFKRGIPVGAKDSPFLSDYFCNMDGFSSSTQSSKNIRGANGVIYVLNQNKEIRAEYSFVAQGLLEWSVTDLDAMNGKKPLIESMTIVHNGLKRIPVKYGEISNLKSSR